MGSHVQDIVPNHDPCSLFFDVAAFRIFLFFELLLEAWESSFAKGWTVSWLRVGEVGGGLQAAGVGASTGGVGGATGTVEMEPSGSLDSTEWFLVNIYGLKQKNRRRIAIIS